MPSDVMLPQGQTPPSPPPRLLGKLWLWALSWMSPVWQRWRGYAVPLLQGLSVAALLIVEETLTPSIPALAYINFASGLILGAYIMQRTTALRAYAYGGAAFALYALVRLDAAAIALTFVTFLEVGLGIVTWHLCRGWIFDQRNQHTLQPQDLASVITNLKIVTLLGGLPSGLLILLAVIFPKFYDAWLAHIFPLQPLLSVAGSVVLYAFCCQTAPTFKDRRCFLIKVATTCLMVMMATSWMIHRSDTALQASRLDALVRDIELDLTEKVRTFVVALESIGIFQSDQPYPATSSPTGTSIVGSYVQHTQSRMPGTPLIQIWRRPQVGSPQMMGSYGDGTVPLVEIHHMATLPYFDDAPDKLVSPIVWLPAEKSPKNPLEKTNDAQPDNARAVIDAGIAYASAQSSLLQKQRGFVVGRLDLSEPLALMQQRLNDQGMQAAFSFAHNGIGSNPPQVASLVRVIAIEDKPFLTLNIYPKNAGLSAKGAFMLSLPQLGLILVMLMLVLCTILILTHTARIVTLIHEKTWQLQEARDDAEKANKMKSEFLANMSHEIRTPMNGVMGFCDLLKSTPLSTDQQSYVNLVRQSAHALRVVIDDILDFSKLEAGKITIESIDFDLYDLLHSVLALFQQDAAKKGITLQAPDTSHIPQFLQGDPSRVRQILLNFMGNALKFTEKGTVKLGVEVLEKGTTRMRLKFFVQDSGIGVAPDILGKLFEKFTQAETSTYRKYGGTGLGLAICKLLAIRMGGNIGAESHPGEGSCFWVTLSFSYGQKIDVAIEDPLLYKAQHPLKILVAEDTPVNQILIRSLLEKWGHIAQIVNNGAEAVQVLESLNGQPAPDLIFMDLHMPRMDGFEATRHIRASHASWSTIPIVALTADTIHEIQKNLDGLGFDGVALKPLDLKVITQILQKYEDASHPKA